MVMTMGKKDEKDAKDILKDLTIDLIDRLVQLETRVKELEAKIAYCCSKKENPYERPWRRPIDDWPYRYFGSHASSVWDNDSALHNTRELLKNTMNLIDTLFGDEKDE